MPQFAPVYDSTGRLMASVARVDVPKGFVITLTEQRIATHESEDVCQQLCDRLNGACNQWEFENPGATLSADGLDD